MKKIVGLLGDDTQKLLWQEEQTCLLGNSHDKGLPLFTCVTTIATTPQERVVHDTKSTQVGSTMTTSTNV